MLNFDPMKVAVFSEGKSSEHNEDFYGYNDTTFVVADGATDKSGSKYNGKTGGEIASRLVVESCLTSSLNGKELVDLLNEKIAETYQDLNLAKVVRDPKFRFSCFFAVARIVGDEIIITSLGDTGFRINGKEVHRETKRVDIDNAEERARYIAQTGDIESARAHIMPLLLKQFDYQNNGEHELGYGVADGTVTPEKFIRTFKYKLGDIETLEIFSDGYFVIPSGAHIEDWESMHQMVEREDPDKWKKFKSTKLKDDRTVVVVDFHG